MATKTHALPDQDEWDFRNLTAAEFQHVAAYEYARSSPQVLGLWQKWQDTPIPAVKAAPGHDQWCLDTTKAEPVWKIIGRDYPDGIEIDPTKQDAAQGMIARCFPLELASVGLEWMLLQVPAFPAPYFHLTEVQQRRLLAVPIYPPASEGVFRDAGPPGFETGESFAVVVDWTCPPAQIKKAFARWLEEKIKNRPPAKRMPLRAAANRTGKAAQPQYQYLKWLAAWRIRQAGIPFEAAQKLLTGVQKRKRHVWIEGGAEYPCELPVFAHQSNWTESANAAGALIERMFQPVSDGKFSHTTIIPREWLTRPVPRQMLIRRKKKTGSVI
jgi:hypothetical protein